MFEQYTEGARRVIFFARYECGFQGSLSIGSEHLLLGILRQSQELVAFYLKLDPSELFFHLSFSQIASPTPTNVDLPLAEESKRILAYAEEESSRLNEIHIRPEHLLLGILREEQGRAAGTLRDLGAPKLADVRLALAGSSQAELRIGQVVLLTSPVGQTGKYLVVDVRREQTTDRNQSNASRDDVEIVIRPDKPASLVP